MLTFVVQNFLTPVALRRLGLGRTMQWHSTTVAFGAGASMCIPAFVMVPVARALELVLRGSFLRSSYELFFTPVPPREKRATKTFIDVSCDRMGDALGAGVLQLLLIFGPRQAAAPILRSDRGARRRSASGSPGAWTRRTPGVLEHGLLSRAVALNEAEVQDSTTLAALLHTAAVFPEQDRPLACRAGRPPPVTGRRMPYCRASPTCGRASPARVRAALAPDQPYDAVVVPLRSVCWPGMRPSNGRARSCCATRIAPSANSWTRCSTRSRMSPCAGASRTFWPIRARSAPSTG